MIVFWLVAMVAAPEAAWAQYRPPPREKAVEVEEKDPFEKKVSLERFRRGHGEWDTQELIASGLTALHKDHERILEKLEELQKRVSELEHKMEVKGEGNSY